MTDTLVGDAVVFPQDEGLGSIGDGNEPWHSAGYWGGLAQVVGTSGYVHSGLTFSGHDGANDTVDLDKGRCYVLVSGASVQSTTGGTAAPAYDTTLPASIPVMVVLPSKVTGLDVQDSTTSAVWVAYDTDGAGPGTAGTVYVRTDNDGNQSAPSHPSVKVGEANPDDSSADTRANDNASPTFKQVTTERVGITDDAEGIEGGRVEAYTNDATGGTEDTGIVFSALEAGSFVERMWIHTDSDGMYKYLFGDKDAWETAHSSTWPGDQNNSVNNFHFVLTGTGTGGSDWIGVEYESLQESLVFKTEAPSGKNIAFNFENPTPEFSFGVIGDRFVFTDDTKLGGNTFLELDKGAGETHIVNEGVLESESTIGADVSPIDKIGLRVIGHFGELTNSAHLSSLSATADHEQMLIESDDDTFLKIAAPNSGSVGTGIFLTNMAASDDGRTWRIHHNPSQEIELGYVTSTDDTTNQATGGTTLYTFDKDGHFTVTQNGASGDPAIQIGDAGAGLFVNGSGEVVVVDEAGNTTTLS